MRRVPTEVLVAIGGLLLTGVAGGAMAFSVGLVKDADVHADLSQDLSDDLVLVGHHFESLVEQPVDPERTADMFEHLTHLRDDCIIARDGGAWHGYEVQKPGAPENLAGVTQLCIALAELTAAATDFTASGSSEATLRAWDTAFVNAAGEAAAYEVRMEEILDATRTTTAVIMASVVALIPAIFVPLVWQVRRRRLAVERDVQRDRGHLRLLTRHAPMGFIVLDADGRVESANPAALRMSGLTTTDVNDRPFLGLATATATELFEAVEDLRRRAEPALREVRVTPGPGDVLHLQVAVTPVFDEDGRLSRTIVVLTDVTPMKTVEEELRVQESILREVSDNMREVFYSASADLNTVHHVSKAFEQVWGLPVEAVKKDPLVWAKAIHPDDADRVMSTLTKHISAGESYAIDYRIIRTDGAVRTLHERAVVLLDESGAPSRLVGVVEDVTDVRASEAARTGFVNIVAHELRTPLTPLRIHAHLLASSSSLAETDRARVESIAQNVARIDRVVNAMLDVARAQTGQFAVSHRRVEFSELVEEVVEGARPTFDEKSLSLELQVDRGLKVAGDRHLLEVVLQNLLSNAGKFTPTGGRVVVAARREDKHVVATVWDTGAGIPRDRIERLFRPFEHSHDTNQTTASTLGLGLYLSRLLVDLHGGSIAAESPGIGMGSTFTIRLPDYVGGNGEPTQTVTVKA